MFDTMTSTKILGGLCGTFLVFLLGGWVSELIYSGGGHGDGHAQAYVIPVAGEDGHDAAPVEEGPAFEEVYAMADAAAGERVFRNCRACHSLEEGKNGTGPSLYGVVGRNTGTLDGFDFSGSLVAVVDVWTPEQINDFLTNPKSYAPGTAMGYNGLRSPTDRANLIAYLDALDG
ncbi:MAG: cytochrome c family protein [Rhodobacteraceae bacterium]|nr:cytochrome c family protein [Paracoccaceae bacterium]